ncbi:cation:proton antiporter [Crocosphaera sp. Alani8]|uniref:cation:proton antiporter n=1 Tax=Crocosphaera sp. Alani8 TaxID=3038952 RepID=UPI00313B5533
MTATLSLINNSLQWCHPYLVATATEGENYGKALAVSLSLVSLSIYIFSRFFEEIAARLALPSVLGNLVAGVVIGVSGLHLVVLDGGEINPSLSHLIEILSNSTPEQVQAVFDGPVPLIIDEYAEFGVGVLLFLIGLESDLTELLKVGFQSASVAIVGVILPFVLGFMGLTYIFHVPTLPALFAGAALTATSIGITAKVMQDIGVLKSKEGQIILGAAILDDILGIVILAVVISIVDTGEVDVIKAAKLILIAATFMISAVVMNRFFASWFVTQLEKLKSPNRGMSYFILFILLSFIAGIIGLEPILGAFAAGLILGGTEARERLINGIGVLSVVFSTVFFVSIGAKTDLSVLNPSVPANQEGLIIAGFLIVVAIVGKVTAGFFAFSDEKINNLGIGTGMIPRGEVGLVFAGLGAATGALPPSIDVAIVLMVIGTTFLAPPLLRLVFDTSQSPETLVKSDPDGSV